MAMRRARSRSRSPIRDDKRGGGRRSQGGGNSKMVFISNITYETRWMELKTLIREKAGEVSFVEMLEERDGRPKGCAIAEFKTREDAELCVKNLHRFEFNGRPLGVKEIRDPPGFFRKIYEETGIDYMSRTGGTGLGPRSGDNDARQPPPRSGTYDLFGLSPEFLRQHHIDPPLCDRIYVANLAFNVGTAKIYEVFGLAGKINWIDFHQDKEGRSKGAVVIQFSHPIEAVQAVAMFNNQRLYDRPLLVKMDKFEKNEKKGPEGALPKGLESIGMGLGAGGQPLADVASVVASMRDGGGGSQIGGGLSSSGSSMNPYGYGSGPLSGSASAFERPMGTSSLASSGLGNGSSFASNYNDYGMISGGGDRSSYGGGGPGAGGGLSSSFGSGLGGGSSSSPYVNTPGMGLDYKKPTDYYGGGRSSNVFDSTKQEPYAASSYGGGATSRVIVIKNLPPDYTWQIVRDRVSQFGQIEAIDLVSPGVARIRFVMLQDAERTRNQLMGTSVEGRPIQVDFV